jgi:hypothetical protein
VGLSINSRSFTSVFSVLCNISHGSVVSPILPKRIILTAIKFHFRINGNFDFWWYTSMVLSLTGNSCSADDEITSPYWTSKANYHVHKTWPMDIILLNFSHPHILIFQSILILSSHLHLCSLCDLFPSGFWSTIFMISQKTCEIQSHVQMFLETLFSFYVTTRYICIIWWSCMTWRLHIQMIEAKAFRTFIRIYSLFKSECLSANIKLTLHKALIRSVTAYACPAWEFAAESYLLKLQTAK